MAKKTFSGINIQWPISELILSGKKTIETRTYPIPPKYLNAEMILIETPGKSGKFKARLRGIIKFTNCYKYRNKTAFYKDNGKHFVTPDSEWAWTDKDKWGWDVQVIKLFKTPINLDAPKGIKYTKNIQLDIKHIYSQGTLD